MLKGAIFDLDGTLVDSMQFWETLGADYLKLLGYEPPENINDIFKTFSIPQAIDYYQNKCNVKLSVKEIADGINQMLYSAYSKKIMPKNGVIAFLDVLKANGVKMCIVTSNTHYLAETVLKKNSMDSYFSKIFTVESGKTAAYRTALEYLGTKKSDTVIFEDAFYAIKEAKKDGFLTAGVYDNSAENPEQIKQFSDIYISDYSDMKNFWKLAASLN